MKKLKANKELSSKPLDQLYQAITQLSDPEEAQQFLKDLCTPAELMAMADRWQVANEIVIGKPYRQIHEETGVSITTIGRVARCISYGSGGYEKILQRLREHNGNQ